MLVREAIRRNQARNLEVIVVNVSGLLGTSFAKSMQYLLLELNVQKSAPPLNSIIFPGHISPRTR